jgi:NAD(P)H-hydrate epimerase
MTEDTFETVDGAPVSAVTEEEMRAVDRVAVEEVGLALLQMMEHAGRNLAAHVRAHTTGPVTVLAGTGGNGGGGLACARHLVNHGRAVSVALTTAPEEFAGAPARQLRILDAMDVLVTVGPGGVDPTVAVDALVGYGLSGSLGGTAAALVECIGDAPAVSLDVPTGRDATSGEEPGPAVAPDTVLTLALPKTGLAGLDCPVWLGDIAIPGTVYDRLDISEGRPFEGTYRVRLRER